MATEHDDTETTGTSETPEGLSSPAESAASAGPTDPAETAETAELPEPAETAELPEHQPVGDSSGTSPAHDYSYGDSEPAPASVADPASAQPIEHTAMRGGTAPRALLRDVPAGFPTPPPRPARPNRAPARPHEPRTGGLHGARGRILLGAGVFAAVFLLLLAIGGGLLAYRVLSPASPPPAASGKPTAAANGSVDIGKVSVRAVGTELGVTAVGPRSKRLTPDGEFDIITVEVTNRTEQPLLVFQSFKLTLEDGTVIDPDRPASEAHVADSSYRALVKPDQSAVVHVVFDAPAGSSLSALEIDFPNNPDAGSGSLPLHG